jgi:hypothetical protein
MSVLRVTSQSLNLREQPHTGAEVLVKLGKGQVVARLDQRVWGEGFWRVFADVANDGAYEGYAHSSYIAPEGAPAPAPGQPAPVVPSLPKNYFAPTYLNRALPPLHPTARERIGAILAQCASEGLPFAVFEAYRTPHRQQHLKTLTPKVTNAGPWQSIHQYGLAADIVLFVDGKWSWETKGQWAKAWPRLHEIARKQHMEPLSFEMPHLQIMGYKWDRLFAGQYPDGGDDAWASHMAMVADAWTGSNKPKLPSTEQRPPLDELHV